MTRSKRVPTTLASTPDRVARWVLEDVSAATGLAKEAIESGRSLEARAARWAYWWLTAELTGCSDAIVASVVGRSSVKDGIARALDGGSKSRTVIKQVLTLEVVTC